MSSGFGLSRDAYDTLESRIADLESGIEESVSDVYDGVRQHGDGVASEAEQPRRGEALRAPLGRKAEHCRNRLIRRVRASGEIVSLSYDADGNRVGKLLLDPEQAELRSTRYLVDVNNHTGYAQVVEQRANTGGGFGLDAVYTYGHDLISQDRYAGELADIAVAQSSDYSLRFFAYDGHGAVRELLDETGAVTDAYEYDAFGVLLSGSGGTRNDYLYAGEQFDSDLGMYFLRARYLNATSGRFHTMDSYEGRNGEPLTLHKYLYAHGNPVMGIDPSGNAALTAELALGNFARNVLNGLSSPRILGAVATVGNVFANTVLIGAGAYAGANVVSHIILTRALPQARARVKVRVEEKARSKGCATPLFHYTDYAGMIGIVADSAIRATDGFSSRFPSGAYGTVIPPFAVDWTQKSLSALFRGGFEDYPFTHFVAFCGPDFSNIPGTLQWWRPAFPKSLVPIKILTHGPNLMGLGD